MLRLQVAIDWVIVASLVGASFLLTYGLNQLAIGPIDALILGGALGLGWIAPLAWGRRGAIAVALGVLAGVAATRFQSGTEFALLGITGVEVFVGWRYSKRRRFDQGLNRVESLVHFSIASTGAALVRGLLVAVAAVGFGLPAPFEVGFAAFGLIAFFHLIFASIWLAPRGRWSQPWTPLRVLELVGLLAASTGLCHELIVAAGPRGVEYTAPSVVALIVLKTGLALRFHIRGIALHRTIWLGLLIADLLARGDVAHLLPFDRSLGYCGQYSGILAILLFVEMLIAAVASDRQIEATANAVLTRQLMTRNAELEKLAAADAEQKVFLDAVLNQMPAGVMIVGPDGEIRWRNSRHRLLWNDTTAEGVRLKDLRRNPISATKEQSVPFESWPIVKAITGGIVTEGYEARILSAKGFPVDVAISASPVAGPAGNRIGAVSILHDMTERKVAIREIRENEERLRFALRSARMIAYELSISTQALQCSEPLAQWVGPDSEPVVYLGDLYKIVHPNDQPLLRSAIGKLLGDGRECECEFRIPRAGEMLWVQCRGRRILDEDGRPTDRIAGIILDVSERRRSEERLRLLESAVVHARDAVVILEPAPNSGLGRCVLYANDAFCRNTGYAIEELRGRSLHFLRGPESDAATLERLRDSLDNGNPFQGELLNYRRDGSTFWVEISVVPVPDGSGRCAHWVMIQRDIGERKQTGLILERSQAQLADAQRVAKLGSWEFLPGSGEWTWSAERFRIFGFEPAAVVPSLERYLNSVYPDDREKVARAWAELLRTNEPARLDFRIVWPSGGIRFVGEQYRCDRDGAGRALRYWGTTQDETEKRQAQEQLFQSQKMELIGQMAGGIAHDFNNLLTGIIGNLHLVQLEPDEPNQKHVGTALRAANRASDLTKKLLGFARKNQLILRRTRLDEVVAEVVGFISRTFDPRVRVVAEIDQEHGILADATLISQVLLNLCLNARDAMPQGGRVAIRSAIVLAQEATGREYVCISVEDTGHGMAPELLQRVFEPFFTTKPTGQGTGLGLAMVHGILTQHSGWVEVKSELGKGTRFDLYLPRAKLRRGASNRLAERPGGEVAPAHPTPPPVSLLKQTILLVDDESMIRDLGRAVLESAGYIVLEAEDGEAAIELFRAGGEIIDLVLLDLTMPKLSGQDTFRMLVSIDPRVRVLFSSGYSAENLVGTEGALGLLPKPYRPQVLLETIRRALAMPRGTKCEPADESGVILSRLPTPAELASSRRAESHP